MIRRVMLFICLALPLSVAAAEDDPSVKVREAREVMEEITAIPEKAIPPGLLKDAQAIAIIPGVIKAGFIVGGRYGEGVILRKQKDGNWSAPVFMTLAGGSFGFQIGAQSIDVILVFKNRRGLDSIVNGKFTLGADASVAAGPVGRTAAAATDTNLKAEILSYSRSRGLFAGVALDGSVLEINHGATSSYYGQEGLTPLDVFDGKVSPVPDEVQDLQAAIK